MTVDAGQISVSHGRKEAERGPSHARNLGLASL